MTNPADHDPDRTELLAKRAPGQTPARDGDLPRGTRLGRYRIEALLGRGGMGEVYRAEQLEPVRRTVALKLLRGHALDPRRKAHFEIERQVLAQMRHAAIAQIYDADTTPEGHPFFAMEFVDGQPITTFCEARALPLAQRLALFIETCEGVQHAHQKGVIHRDLKPGNLLVDDGDGRPHPKIIDFGIATAAERAGTREIAGTPDYMSPEQAGGDQALLDTRSDVYSLGVVLSELLTGQRPLNRGETHTADGQTLRLPSAQLQTLAPGEAERIAQARGQRLPALRRALRSELDWVVARAMQHDRNRRYPSAAALAEDLRRYLEGRPLLAVPAARGYVWRKFARRHRAGMAAAAVALCALLGGLALSLHGLMQARAQRALAEQRSGQLERVAAFQQSLLEEIDVEGMGLRLGQDLRQQVARSAPQMAGAAEQVLARVSTADLARSLMETSVLARAEQAIDRDFADQPGLAADLREASGRVHEALGLYAGAERAQAAVAAWRVSALGPRDPATLRARRAHAEALRQLSRYDESRAMLESALADAAGLPADDGTRALIEYDLAEVQGLQGDLPGAATARRALLERLQSSLGAEERLVLQVKSGLAMQMARMGDLPEARALLEDVLAVRRRVLGDEHADTVASMSALATAMAMQGDLVPAVALQRTVVAVQGRRLGSEHPDTLGARGNLANMLSDRGDTGEAVGEAAAVADARRRVLGEEHPMTLRGLLNLASLRARLDDFAGALPLERQVLEARTRLLGPDHPDTLFVALNHAMTLTRADQLPRAQAQFAETMPRALDVLGTKHPQYQLAMVAWGHALHDAGDLPGAAVQLRAALALREQFQPAGSHQVVDTAWSLIGVLREMGGSGNAEADALHARLVAPLLAADADTLDPRQRRLREAIEEALAADAGLLARRG
ncbi:serine/threonine-protein kinase [uncultured Luteimonas sp.]|uniref:serine/threonine-protein kinase n=1 Tax=uncultured Luteimonas sp. TaxID=453144 RepID=UPI002636A97E|nr:serine/threonine-protein kinase [uncultured Luteimonas sp.]